MLQNKHKPGFTLIEVMVVVTVILIMAGVIWKMGRGLDTQGKVQQQKEAFAILDSALQAYYEVKGEFPVMVKDDDDDLEELVLAQARTESMWHQLISVPESRFVAERLSPSLLKTLYLSDDEIKQSEDTDVLFVAWPEVYDVWGRPVDYQWQVDTAFPILKSMGPNPDPNVVSDDIFNR